MLKLTRWRQSQSDCLIRGAGIIRANAPVLSTKAALKLPDGQIRVMGVRYSPILS